MKYAQTILFVMLVATLSVTADEVVDLKGFFVVSKEVSEYRKKRLVSIEEFNLMAKDKDTIILDTRSASSYARIHLSGAININFSDFTEDKLTRIIPNKNTRILIYCNNNFKSEREALLDKSLPLALNLPTFINLYGYGYKNVYELKDKLKEDDKRLKFVGSFQKEENKTE